MTCMVSKLYKTTTYKGQTDLISTNNSDFSHFRSDKMEVSPEDNLCMCSPVNSLLSILNCNHKPAIDVVIYRHDKKYIYCPF